MIYYSKLTGGFYDSQINLTIPSDAKLISKAAYEALLQAQRDGKIITAAADGLPEVQEPPPLSAQQIASIRQQAKIAIDAQERRKAFRSNVLGTPHHYEIDDGAVLWIGLLLAAGVDSKIECRDVYGNIERIQHTAQQIRDLSIEMIGRINIILDKS